MSKEMTTESQMDPAAASHRIVQDIFEHPPKSSIDLRERLAQVERPSARQAVVDRLAGSNLSDRDGPLILAVLDIIGIGQERGRLVSAALNTQGEARVRMWAAMALAGDDPRMMDLLVTELGPEGMAHLAENALIDLMTIQQPARIGTTVKRSLEEWHRDLSSEKLLARIEMCRRGLGISCIEAYGPSVESRRLEHIRPLLLDCFVREASDDGAAFLDDLRQREKDPDARHKLQAALLRLRSANIDLNRRIRKAAGAGWVSNCDGNGGFIVLGVFENPDGTRTVAEVYLQVAGELLEAVMHPRLKPERTDELVSQLAADAGCHFAPISLSEAAALISAGMEHVQEEPDPDLGEIRQVLRMFSRMPGAPFASEAPAPEAEPLSEETIRALLSRPEYEDTWLFDASDFAAAGVPLPEGEDSGLQEEWLRDAQVSIANSSKRNRLIAMADHMARWHARQDDFDAARTAASLANEIRTRPEEGLLIRVMLERSHPERVDE